MGDSRQQANDVAGRKPEEVKAEQPPGRAPDKPYPTPLFLRDVNEGAKGNAQDEKDGSEE
jgi:hypothetical protein